MDRMACRAFPESSIQFMCPAGERPADRLAEREASIGGDTCGQDGLGQRADGRSDYPGGKWSERQVEGAANLALDIAVRNELLDACESNLNDARQLGLTRKAKRQKELVRGDHFVI